MNEFLLFWFFSFVVIIFIVATTYSVYILLDMSGKSTTVIGRVINKTYSPHGTHNWINSHSFGHNSYLTSSDNQRNWYLIIEVQNKQKKVRVSRAIFKSFDINDDVDVGVAIGRFSKKIQIIDITPYQPINAHA